MTTTGSSDPRRTSTDYYPWWLDQLADDVTGEGAAMQGVLHGAEAVRTLVSTPARCISTRSSTSPATMVTRAFSKDTPVKSRASPPALLSP